MELKRLHSICIPRIDGHISKHFIFNVFCNLKIGFIERILELPIKNDPNYKRIIIYVKWNKSDMSQYIQTRFNEQKNVKVVYSMPWYWICVANRIQTVVSNNRL